MDQGCGTYSVGDSGEGAHVLRGQLPVQDLQIRGDVLRVDCFKCCADATLHLPAQQHLQRARTCLVVLLLVQGSNTDSLLPHPAFSSLPPNVIQRDI